MLLQYGFFPAQPFRFGFGLGNIGQELANESGDGCILFRRFHAGTAVDIIVHGNCDIFHSFTVLMFCDKFQRYKRDPILKGGELLFQPFEQHGGQIAFGEGGDDNHKVLALVFRAAANLDGRCQRSAR